MFILSPHRHQWPQNIIDSVSVADKLTPTRLVSGELVLSVSRGKKVTRQTAVKNIQLIITYQLKVPRTCSHLHACMSVSAVVCTVPRLSDWRPGLPQPFKEAEISVIRLPTSQCGASEDSCSWLPIKRCEWGYQNKSHRSVLSNTFTVLYRGKGRVSDSLS